MTGIDERVETAYHEAGHAVALYALGFDFGDVSIVAEGSSRGRMATPMEDAVFERRDVLEYLGEDGEAYMRRQMMVAFSGVKAVGILTGQDHDPRVSDAQFWLPGSDWNRLQRWLMVLAGPGEHAAVYGGAWDQTEHVLRENWDAVVAVAEALLEREELDAGALRSTLDGAGCARDSAPIRRVVLELEGDLLRERRLELMEEGGPDGELEDVEERIARGNAELEELRGEERS